MILLDTNVLSALMRPEPERIVIDWLDSQPAESVWTTSVTVFEIRFGLEILPSGRRRRMLEELFKNVLREDLEDRVVSFDESAAEQSALIAAAQRRIGSAIEIRDVQIAGIAIARNATLATRNVKHFQGLGAELVNPWD